MSLPLPINEVTTPLYKGIFEKITDKTRLENFHIYGQCPIWVIELAADHMEGDESYAYDYRIGGFKSNTYGTKRTGKALNEHIASGDNKKLLSSIKRNFEKIEKHLPGEWTGVLKQEFARQANLSFLK